MSRRTLRIVAVLALAAAVAAAYRWWVSPERQIRAILDDVAAAFTHESRGSGLDALANVAALQRHLADNITVAAADGTRIAGRQEVITAAARIRAAAPARRVRFFDPRISIDGGRATLAVTAEVTTRADSGEDLVDVHQVRATLARPQGRWLVSEARTVPRAEPSS
jgi:hypothetical protein